MSEIRCKKCRALGAPDKCWNCGRKKSRPECSSHDTSRVRSFGSESVTLVCGAVIRDGILVGHKSGDVQ